MTREVAISLLAAWLGTWATEERALDAAARANLLPTDAVNKRRAVLRLERERVTPLLAA